MATIAQGLRAGELANGLNAIAAFVLAMSQAKTAGGQVTQITLSVTGQIGAIAFNPPSPLTVADSAALLSDLVTLSAGLTGEWTSELNGL